MSTQTATIATRANMRKFEEANPGRDWPDGSHTEGRRCVALDLDSGETFSATSGDYFQLGEDEPLRSESGEPLILVTQRTVYLDALNGEPLDPHAL